MPLCGGRLVVEGFIIHLVLFATVGQSRHCVRVLRGVRVSASKQAIEYTRNNPNTESRSNAPVQESAVARTSWYDDSCQDLYLRIGLWIRQRLQED